MLRKINDSEGNVVESIAKLEAELKPLQQQRNELATIIKAINLESSISE